MAWPQFVDQFVSLGLGMASVHGRELVVGDMLEGNVEVFADFGFVRAITSITSSGKAVG